MRFTGISGGAIPTLLLAFEKNINAVELMEMWKNGFERNHYSHEGSFIFIPVDNAHHVAHTELNLYNITDGLCKKAADQNRFFVGISQLHWARICGVPVLPYFKHYTVPFADNSNELALNFVRTCCVPGIFGIPSRHKDTGKLCVDGGLSAVYTVPDCADPKKTVRVSPWPWVPGDIMMSFKPWFHFWNCFFLPEVEQYKQLFQEGYKEAEQNRQVFINAGFTPMHDHTKVLGLKGYMKSFESNTALRTQRRSGGLGLHHSISTPNVTNHVVYNRFESPRPTKRVPKVGSHNYLRRNGDSLASIASSLDKQHSVSPKSSSFRPDSEDFPDNPNPLAGELQIVNGRITRA